MNGWFSCCLFNYCLYYFYTTTAVPTQTLILTPTADNDADPDTDIGKIVRKGKDLFGRPVIFIYAGKHNKYKRSVEELKVIDIGIYTL